VNSLKSSAARSWKKAAAMVIERTKAESAVDAYKEERDKAGMSQAGGSSESGRPATMSSLPSVSETEKDEQAAEREREASSIQAALDDINNELREVEQEVVVARMALSGLLRMGGDVRAASFLGAIVFPAARELLPSLQDMINQRREEIKTGVKPIPHRTFAAYTLAADVAYEYPVPIVDYLDCFLGCTMDVMLHNYNDERAIRMMKGLINSCGCYLARVESERTSAKELLAVFDKGFSDKKAAFVALAKATELLEPHRMGLLQEATLLAMRLALLTTKDDNMEALLGFVQTLFPVFPIDVVYGCCKLIFFCFDSGSEKMFSHVVQTTITSLRNMDINPDLFSHVLSLGLSFLTTESKTMYRSGALLSLSILKKLPKGSVKARAVVHRMKAIASLDHEEDSTTRLLRLMLRGVMDEDLWQPTMHLMFEFSARVMQQGAGDATIVAAATIATAIMEDSNNSIWSALTEALSQVVEDFFVQDIAGAFSKKDDEDIMHERSLLLSRHPFLEKSTPSCTIDRVVAQLCKAGFVSTSNIDDVFQLFIELIDYSPRKFVVSSLLSLHALLRFGSPSLTVDVLRGAVFVFYQYMYSVDVEIQMIAARCFHVAWSTLEAGGHPVVSVWCMCGVCVVWCVCGG